MKLSQIVKAKKVQILLPFLILLVAFFLRFHNLSIVPPALYQDETSIGFNAYSILETQRDEYGKFFPVYFKSFGDQKLPAYIYLTALSEKFFGLNEFSVRFPSAFFGSLSVIFLYFLVKRLTKRNDVALIASIFLAVNPWHLHFSRAGFEVNVALFFAITGSLFFVLAAEKKKLLLMTVSIFSFAMSLYSYNLTRLLSPALFLILVILYWKDVKQFDKVKVFLILVFGGFLLSPFIYTFLSAGGASSARGALITSTDIEAKIVELRGYYLFLPEIFNKIFFNKYVYLVWTYITNLAGIFSFPFFFVSGTLHGNQGIGNVGMFYVFELPLILLGIYTYFKDKLKEYTFFICWGVVVLLILGLSKEVPHATRGYFFVIPGTVFSALGLMLLVKEIGKLKTNILKYGAFAAGIFLVLYSLVFYFTSYYQRFPTLYAKSFRTADKELSLYLAENQNRYDTVIFDEDAGFMYSSLLFYGKFSPSEFQSSVVREKDDAEGFSKVLSFGKYSFKKIDWPLDSIRPRTLIITTLQNKPVEIPADRMFSYPIRPVALSLKEELKQFAVEEPAYVLVETK